MAKNCREVIVCTHQIRSRPSARLMQHVPAAHVLVGLAKHSVRADNQHCCSSAHTTLQRTASHNRHWLFRQIPLLASLEVWPRRGGGAWPCLPACQPAPAADTVVPFLYIPQGSSMLTLSSQQSVQERCTFTPAAMAMAAVCVGVPRLISAVLYAWRCADLQQLVAGSSPAGTNSSSTYSLSTSNSSSNSTQPSISTPVNELQTRMAHLELRDDPPGVAVSRSFPFFTAPTWGSGAGGVCSHFVLRPHYLSTHSPLPPCPPHTSTHTTLSSPPSCTPTHPLLPPSPCSKVAHSVHPLGPPSPMLHFCHPPPSPNTHFSHGCG